MIGWRQTAAVFGVSALISAALAQDPEGGRVDGPPGQPAEGPVGQPAAPGAGGAAPALAPAQAPRSAKELERQLAELREDPIFRKAVAGAYVADADTGAMVWSIGEEQSLIPASVMKTLTAAVALKRLGPTWRFPTWVMVEADGASEGGKAPVKIDEKGVLQGNLYIKGQGDPTMVMERMWKMIYDIRMMGITEIKGDVVFDDGYFQDSTWIPGWAKPEDVSSGPTYFAPLGALSLNYNVATIVVRPGAAAGLPAVAAAEVPTPVVVVEGNLTTGRAGSRLKLDLDREVKHEAAGDVTRFKLTGTVPEDGDVERIYKSIADPLSNYIGGFAMLAQQQGLKIKGRARPGNTPKSAVLKMKVESDPLVNILAEMNKHSNNFIAEQVLRSVGAEVYGLPGTTAKGAQAVGEMLKGMGIPEADLKLVNGSGLSRDVRMHPSTIVRMLTALRADTGIGPEFLTTLSVGGRDGTLWSRFREEGMAGRVRGKTGTLTGVSCLAGYVASADGHTYAFAFLVNDIDGGSSRARPAHDKLVRALAGLQRTEVPAGEEDGAPE